MFIKNHQLLFMTNYLNVIRFVCFHKNGRIITKKNVQMEHIILKYG